MAEARDRITAQATLLACHSLREHSPYLRLQGKQQLGMAGEGSDVLIYNPVETYSSLSQHNPVVYCNLIKLNTN